MTYLYSHMESERVEVGHMIRTRSWGKILVLSIQPPAEEGAFGKVKVQYATGNSQTFDASSLQCEWRGFDKVIDPAKPLRMFSIGVSVLVSAEDEQAARVIASEFLPAVALHESVESAVATDPVNLTITKEQFDHG